MKNYLLILLIALVVIFFKFNQIPAHLTFDEVEFARLSVLLSTHEYTPYTEYATGHATMYFYLILASFKLFGLNEFALRLPSAIFGILTSGMLYLVMQEVFKKRSLHIKSSMLNRELQISYALLVSICFILMRWFFGFARFSFEGTCVLFLELVSLYGLLMYLRKPHVTRWLVLTALGAGLAYNSYQPGRFFFLIPLVMLVITPAIRSVRSVALFVVIVGLLIAPLSIHLYQHPDIRVKQQLYFQDQNLTIQRKALFFADNVWRNTKLFFIEGDASGRHNYPFKPALPLPLALLATYGCIVALQLWRKPIPLIFLLYAGIAMGPTLLTYPHENPNMLRTITVLPALVYFIGLSVEDLYHRLHQRLPSIGLILVAVVLMSGISDLRTYFIYQREIFPQAFEVTDRFGGVYYFMKERGIDINAFRIPADQIEKFYSVPGPMQIYRNQ